MTKCYDNINQVSIIKMVTVSVPYLYYLWYFLALKAKFTLTAIVLLRNFQT